MPDRMFRYEQSVGHRKCFRLTCKKCGVSQEIEAAANGGAMPPEAVEKRFKRKGWSVGQNASSDICPGCVLKSAPPRGLVLKLPGINSSIPIGVIEMPKDTVVPIKADAPRTMSRDDRRIIFSKLEAVYLDEKRGYDEGWTDERVSKDLGVPRAWVATVRDENFGPMVSPDDIVLAALREGLKVKSASAKAKITECREVLNHIEAIMNDIERIEERSKIKAA